MPKKIKHNYTDYNDWFDEYKPVLNHFHNNEDESWNGRLYETFGQEDAYIEKLAEESPNTVWTILDDDYGEVCVTNGWHYVNRIGYLVTEKPWKDGDDFNIYDADDIRKKLRRESRERNKLKNNNHGK